MQEVGEGVIRKFLKFGLGSPNTIMREREREKEMRERLSEGERPWIEGEREKER